MITEARKSKFRVWEELKTQRIDGSIPAQRVSTRGFRSHFGGVFLFYSDFPLLG